MQITTRTKDGRIINGTVYLNLPEEMDNCIDTFDVLVEIYCRNDSNEGSKFDFYAKKYIFKKDEKYLDINRNNVIIEEKYFLFALKDYVKKFNVELS